VLEEDAKGKTTIAGRSGPVKLQLTRAGIKLLEKAGSLKIAVLETVTDPETEEDPRTPTGDRRFERVEEERTPRAGPCRPVRRWSRPIECIIGVGSTVDAITQVLNDRCGARTRFRRIARGRYAIPLPARTRSTRDRRRVPVGHQSPFDAVGAGKD
jgi:hypothetical protein